ncbi:MAG: hypothetical protein PHP86_00430 [Nevskiales bacterium]|nr:hypothetical protein [Nevskiales bacterium]
MANPYRAPALALAASAVALLVGACGSSEPVESSVGPAPVPDGVHCAPDPAAIAPLDAHGAVAKAGDCAAPPQEGSDGAR